MIGGVEQEYRVGNRVVPPGELVETGRGWVEPTPVWCPRGHKLHDVTVGWAACPTEDRRGHRLHYCGCGAKPVYTPPVDEGGCWCQRRKTTGG